MRFISKYNTYEKNYGIIYVWMGTSAKDYSVVAECHMKMYIYKFPIYKFTYHIYQPLCSGRIWHKVNF